MDGVTAYCFGGPLNEQTVAYWSNVMPVAIPTPVKYNAVDPPDAMSTVLPYRTVLYHAERYGYHGEVWTAWVADGYPRHRITDALNTIAAMSRLMTGV